PISSTRSPGASRASSSMIAIIDGAWSVWPRPLGSGTSAYASSASSGRTNASRGTARNASRTPGSRMYREATSCSTRRAREAAKTGPPPIGRPPPTPGIKSASRGDEEGNQDRREDQGRQRDGQPRFHEVLHRYRDPVPRRDLHDDDQADEEQDDAPVHFRDQGPGRRLRKEREEEEDERSAREGHQREPRGRRGCKERGRHPDRHGERHDETGPLERHDCRRRGMS